MIGSVNTDSPTISSPLPLQSSPARRSNREHSIFFDRQPRPPTQVPNRLRALDLTLSPSQMFPSYRLSATSSVASPLSPSVYSPPPTGTAAGFETSGRAEPFPTKSSNGSSDDDAKIKGQTRRRTRSSAPRMSRVEGVVHQTPRPSEHLHIPTRSETAVPIPLIRLRSEGVTTLQPQSEMKDDLDDEKERREGVD